MARKNSMEKIGIRSKFLEQSPPMTSPIINKPKFNDMIDYRYNMIKVLEPENPNINTHNYLAYL